MIYIHCPRCRKRIPVGTLCSCYNKQRDSKARLSVDSFYNTVLWERARSDAIAEVYGLDIYALYTRREIVSGYTVHHIVPLEKDFSVRADMANLIYLTEADHRHIHELYKRDYSRTVKMLRELKERFAREFGRDRLHGSANF